MAADTRLPSAGSRRVCVIFNPTARGEQARRCREFLQRAAGDAELVPTTGPGAARALARDAVLSGFERIIAAGGDGTVFEVMNGMADAPDGLARAALGVLPLGTANVLAHELGMPGEPRTAWRVLQHAIERRVDGCHAEFRDDDGAWRQAHFAIVAGAGLDARAVQQVNWNLKRRLGKLAYVAAAVRALVAFRDRVRCSLGDDSFSGRVVLAGNGRLYAGEIAVFGDGALDSGRLHVRGVDRVTPGVLARCLHAWLTGRWTLESRGPAASVEELILEGEGRVPLQLDGEFVGWLPARLRVLPGALRVLVPTTGSGELGVGSVKCGGEHRAAAL